MNLLIGTELARSIYDPAIALKISCWSQQPTHFWPETSPHIPYMIAVEVRGGAGS